MFPTIEYQYRVGIEFSDFVFLWCVRSPRLIPTEEDRPNYFDTIKEAVNEQNRRFRLMGTTYKKFHSINQYSLSTHNADRTYGSLWTIHSPRIKYEFEQYKKKTEAKDTQSRTEEETFSAFLRFRLTDTRSNRYNYPKGCDLANVFRKTGIPKTQRRGKVSVLGETKDGKRISPRRRRRKNGKVASR